jgi:histone acetyltransferase MYST1
MVLPPYQRKGYGQFLISMSYYFSKQEGRICTPEVPLSDLGKISYKSYWTSVILETLKNRNNLSVKELSEETFIRAEDVSETLKALSLVSLIYNFKVKYWKGQQVIQCINSKQISDFLERKNKSKQNYLKFNPKYFKNNV